MGRRDLLLMDPVDGSVLNVTLAVSDAEGFREGMIRR